MRSTPTCQCAHLPCPHARRALLNFVARSSTHDTNCYGPTTTHTQHASDEEPPSKRHRLSFKLNRERKQLIATKVSHEQLRNNLESLRQDIIQYRDAIGQAGRQLQSSVLEKRALEEEFASTQEEYCFSVKDLEQSRTAYEKKVSELRARLIVDNQSTQDAADRLTELRHLEGQITETRATNTALDTQLRAAQLKVRLYEETIAAYKITPPADAAADDVAAAAAAAAAAASATTTTTADAAAAAAVVAATPVPADAAVASEWVKAPDATVADPAVTAAAVAAATEAGEPARVVAYIQTHANRIAHLQAVAQEHVAAANNAAAALSEREMQMEKLTLELERCIALNEELKLKRVLDEQALEVGKVESARHLDEVARLTRELDEQAAEFAKQEEKTRAHSEILLVADARATQSEEQVREIVAEVDILRNGNRQLQIAFNKVVKVLSAISTAANGGDAGAKAALSAAGTTATQAISVADERSLYSPFLPPAAVAILHRKVALLERERLISDEALAAAQQSEAKAHARAQQLTAETQKLNAKLALVSAKTKVTAAAPSVAVAAPDVTMAVAPVAAAVVAAVMPAVAPAAAASASAAPVNGAL
jgi:hypothetical protein